MSDDGESPKPAESRSDAASHKRAPKPTEKALEEQTSRLMSAKRSKQVTSKKNKITALMHNNESPDVVNEHLNECSKLLQKFIQANANALLLLPEDEHEADQKFWFDPKKEELSRFMTVVNEWVADRRQKQHTDMNTDNSVLVTDIPSSKKSSYKSKASSSSSRSSRASTIMSARQKEQAERAALLAHAASLKQKQELEMEECKLKARMDQLKIETAIAVSTTKIKVFENY